LFGARQRITTKLAVVWLIRNIVAHQASLEIYQRALDPIVLAGVGQELDREFDPAVKRLCILPVEARLLAEPATIPDRR